MDGLVNIYDPSDPTVEKDYYIVSIVRANTLDAALRKILDQQGPVRRSCLPHLELTEELSEAMRNKEPVLHLDDLIPLAELDILEGEEPSE